MFHKSKVLEMSWKNGCLLGCFSPNRGVVGLRHQPRYSSVNSISSVGSTSSGEKTTNDDLSSGKSKFYIPSNTRDNSTIPRFPPESFGQSSALPQGGRDPWVPLTSSHKYVNYSTCNLFVSLSLLLCKALVT